MIIHPWFTILESQYKKVASYKREAGASKPVEFRMSFQNPYTYKRLYNSNIKTKQECVLLQLCISCRCWIRSTWATQVVAQQQFVAMFTFTTDISPSEDVGPGLRRYILLQHCINDGDRYCLIECKFGVGLGLFRAAFLETFSTHSNLVYQITA